MRCVPLAMIMAILVQPATPAPAAAPKPGVGVFFTADEVPALRQKIGQPPCKATYDEMVKQTDAAMQKWPELKAKNRVEELAPKLLDLQVEFIPKEFMPDGGKEAGKLLAEYSVRHAGPAAFLYVITGDRKYADFAWDVFQLCAKTGRWGWFPWSGAHMPQIHYGIMSRNMVLVADCVWDTLSESQRQSARQTIADKVVEPYYRIVLHAPGMGLNHLRSKNQGNNALGAAVIGSLFVGDAVPDNKIWLNSLIQTWHWIITHDIGWMGQGLESGIGGYWTVSMQNLYTVAAALKNVKGMDLRGHPAFEQATYYPLIHEVTVPPGHGPYPEQYQGPMGVIGGKPMEVPGGGGSRCGPWWYDYAANFPDSAAPYFIHKAMLTPERLQATDGHQGGLADVLKIAWFQPKLLQAPKPPSALTLMTDRMASLRSGYGYGPTCLYFNGDLWLSAKKDVFCCTSGWSWHYPWHQFQVTETGVETEGELYAPSMVIKEASDDPSFTYFQAQSGTSNVTYYPKREQLECWKNYDYRTRAILYARPSEGTSDYFFLVDRVRHKDDHPRWHAWLWHVLNHAADRANFGRYVLESDHALRVQRPHADLWIQFITPSRLSFEQQGVPTQLNGYEMDHHVTMLRALAGGCEPATAKAVTIPPSAWPGLGVEQEGNLYLEKPPTQKEITSGVIQGLVGGQRYKFSLKAKEEAYRVYEATAWSVALELLDAAGNVVAKPATGHGTPSPLRVGAPQSNNKTHDWTETATYFDAPKEAVACRAKFFAVGWAHYFELGKLWLSPIELKPLGTPNRSRQQMFVALVMPLDKDAPAPKIVSTKANQAAVTHTDGSVDEITVSEDGKLSLQRRKGDRVLAAFPGKGDSGGTTSALTTNSDSSAAALRQALKGLVEDLNAQRDAVVKTGRPNLALVAKVTASETRDGRFAVQHVIDNQTAEYPVDGHLDYTQGTVISSSRFAGYGDGPPESLFDTPAEWPLYVRPSYWLLPQGKLGHVELELKDPAAVDLVRVLNTSNAGLNDFATHQFKVELYDADHKLLTAKEATFGKVFDGAFKQSFVEPKWFSRYSSVFKGMLDPGLTVPFGDGWKDVPMDTVRGVKFVRIVVTKYWGIGGGLNEVQVYGRP